MSDSEAAPEALAIAARDRVAILRQQHLRQRADMLRSARPSPASLAELGEGA